VSARAARPERPTVSALRRRHDSEPEAVDLFPDAADRWPASTRIRRAATAEPIGRSLPTSESTRIRRAGAATAAESLSSPGTGLEGGPLDAGLSTRIRAASGGGVPLEDGTRNMMERGFGVGLGDVRIHRNSDVAPRINATAFTLGADIHFAPGQYAPGSVGGRELLAHELAHVVQQTGRATRIQARLVVGPIDDPAEREADRIADRAMTNLARPAREIGEEVHAVAGGTINRRVDMTALVADITTANTIPDRKSVFARLVQPLWQKLSGLYTAQQLKARLQNLATAWTVARDAHPYVAATALANVQALAGELNQMEDEATILAEAAGINVNDQAALQNVLQQLQARHLEAQDAVATLAPGNLAALNAAQAQAAQTTGVPALAFNPVTANKDVAAFIETLRTQEELVDPKNLMKVGTEFTFTNDDLMPLDIEVGGVPLAAAVTVIDAWVAEVPRRKIFAGDGNLADPVVTRGALNFSTERTRKNRPDGNGQKSAKFVYTLPSGAQWWWNADIDYGCIETQADPATRRTVGGEGGNDSEAINSIINTHIFSAASALGVNPHAEVGGGHLSLDRTTTFGDNARWLRNFLVLYANQPNKWKAEDVDAFNAPMITELTTAGRRAFRDTIREFDVAWGGNNPWTIDTLINKLTTNVFKASHFTEPETEAEEKANPKRKGQPAHYQATNVEHVTDLDVTKQRLEMRRFNAQTSLEDLLNNMDALASLAAASRKPGLVNMAGI
jgi:hypothetical protein